MKLHDELLLFPCALRRLPSGKQVRLLLDSSGGGGLVVYRANTNVVVQAKARRTAASIRNDLYPRLIVYVDLFHVIVSETFVQASRGQFLPS